MMVGAFISIFILLGAVLWKLFSIENRLLSLQVDFNIWIKGEKAYRIKNDFEENIDSLDKELTKQEKE